MNLNRRERTTTLITLSIGKNSNTNSVQDMIRKEKSTAVNIKDKTARKHVLKALFHIIRWLGKHPQNIRGFLVLSAFDGL